MADRTVLDFVDRVLPDTLQGDTWAAWRVVLRAIFALPMTDTELEQFEGLTGRSAPPSEPVSEFWAVVGRRGGKSFVAALVACYLAAVKTYQLQRGEKGVLPVVAADRRQARVIRDYVVGILRSTAPLEAMIEEELKESVTLTNGITIEIATASHRTIRGRTCIGAVCDEIAFWRTEDDAADPDRAILDALRPAMSTVEGALLLCLSTPYARRGELYRAVTEEQPDDVLVVRADTATMNPSVDQRVIDRAFERDPVAAMSEYGREGEIEFRSDVSALLAEDALQAVIPDGVRELPPDKESRAVAAFDAATGAGADSAALGIAFRSSKGAQLAAVREWRPPFSPSKAIKEAAKLCKKYGCDLVTIDRYAPGLIAEQFEKRGIRARVSKLDTSRTFLQLLALINSELVTVLDHARLVNQLRRLERSGRDRVGHPHGSHDDIAAACAAALVAAQRPKRKIRVLTGSGDPRPITDSGSRFTPAPTNSRWIGGTWR